MEKINFGLLQAHTVKIYNLNQKEYELRIVPARSLLKGTRFDLFAKLFYIRNRKSEPDFAREIYKEHIKAFNPDLREPGRDDKNGYDDFINAFEALIDDLTINGFDAEKSLIPVDEDGVILDGAHRVSALAYADKQVKIVCFKNVKCKAKFDYEYFLKRGLSWRIADAIALEMIKWQPNMLIGCLWPRMGNTDEKKKVIELINNKYPICYSKFVTTNIESFVHFIAKVYETQSWVGNEDNNFAGARDKAINCYASNKQIAFVLFNASNLEEIIKFKERIRGRYKNEKHSIHITDNVKETRDIAEFVFNVKELEKWNNTKMKGISKLRDFFAEKAYYFKNVTLIKWKVSIASFLNKTRII